ncbi:MAG: pyridoxal-phosphate dependent enzyme [Firmicutes bacterium]|nr:pyridoxal-phosphate dependent enzyme [Bacillota bacterium]
MKENTESITSILEKYPRAELLKTPFLIQRLNRLSSFIGNVIYILRDDLTGFALGGNKTRKLDYLIGDALVKKADTLVTMKASSFSRNAAAAGRVCGFDVHVVLAGDESEQNPASQAFFKQYDTELHYVSKDKESALPDVYNHLVESLKAQGKNVYELHPGGSDSIGALGYIDAFNHILRYSQSSGVHFHRIIHATGSTGTQAGLLLGQCISGYDTHIIGIAVSQKAEVQSKRVNELALSTAQMLGIQFDTTHTLIDDRFIGPGYAISSDEGKNAVKMFASMEGILLDQVYTGKAAAGLLNYAINKQFNHENVLFVHTGGNSDLFY